MLAKLGVKTTCKTCGKEIYVTKSEFEKSESKNFFCCSSCSVTYTNSHRVITEEHHQKLSKILNEHRYIHNTSTKRLQVCKICGEQHCQHPKICKSKFFDNPRNLIKLGFDINAVGSLDVYREFYRVKQVLEEEYHHNQKSIPTLMKQYGIPSERSFKWIFNFFGIESRTRGESISLAYHNGNFKIPETIHYIHGWHTTWENHRVYYRSSYEKAYMELLDQEKIPYDVESFRIRYYSTKHHRWKTAIPDFYLPDTKTIVEVKNIYDYLKHRQTMFDKMKEYKRLGFNFILRLEHVEYDTCI